MIVNDNDPRVKRSRQLIKDAFTQLILESDFESITVKDITERATINRATFYAHYEDKYILLEKLFLDFFDQTLAARNIGDSSFSEETLEKLIMATCDFFSLIKKGCKKVSSSVMSLMEEKIISCIGERIRQMVTRTAAAWHIITEEMELSITMMSWSIYGAALKWSATKPVPPEELAQKAASQLRHGSYELLFAHNEENPQREAGVH